MLTIQQAFEHALRHHQAGRLAEAEALYRQILAAQPNHAEALHHLGVIAHQLVRHEIAVQLIGQAIALQPLNPAPYSNLGEAYRSLGRLDEAIASLRRALELKPDYPAALYNLGNTLQQRGSLDEAITAARRALELQPDYAEAHNCLANALMDQGELDGAIAAYRRVVALQPHCAEAHSNLGNALRERGQSAEAEAACRRALELKPALAEAHNNLGLALKDRGQLDPAIGEYQRALALQPNNAEAHNNLGNALRERGHLEPAIAEFGRALEIKPEHAGFHNNLGNVFRDQGRWDDALAAYRRALELQPDYAEAHSNLGNTLKDRGRLDEAAAAIRRALELKPHLSGAHNNLGNVLKEQGRWDEALAAYRRTPEFSPERLDLHSSLIYSLLFCPGDHAAAISEEQQRWNRQCSQTFQRQVTPHSNDRTPARRLRIGYVSADFRDHVIGRNVLPLFLHQDTHNYEVVCYSGVVRTDALTEVIRRHTASWRDAAGLADDALADLVCQDAIDILVDLTQHMAGNRLPVFARQPAPVQVSFAGYPGTTGVEGIAYRISDRWLEAASEERGVYLLDSFWCYDPCGVEIMVNELPAQHTGHITFGTLNSFCKLNDATLKLWSRVLKEVKDSRLIMLSDFGSHRQRTLEFLKDEGIEPARVEFAERRLHRDYLELYHRLDIILDTFPYNGHTTSLDALWMGVPVVSLAGERAVSRAGLSQLSNLGLSDLVSFNEEGFVEIAVRLAMDLPRLAELRRTLRGRMESSALMDAAHFARSIEAAYRTMWQEWCTQPREA